jgi:nuclear pore complex protein Nup98-Nup96
MFGNTGIQSSWANPQQNQQQPQQPQQPQSGSVFGQPSAFGSTGGGGGGGASFTVDTFSLPFKHNVSFIAQLLDLVEALAKIHNNNLSNLSKRTRCLETLPPILILHLQQGARRSVSLSHPLFGVFLLISISSGAFGGNNNSSFSNTKPASGFGAFGGGGGTSAFGTGGGAFGSTTPSQPAASNPGLFGQTNTTGGAFAGTFNNKPATSAFGPTSCMSLEEFSVIWLSNLLFPL